MPEIQLKKRGRQPGASPISAKVRERLETVMEGTKAGPFLLKGPFSYNQKMALRKNLAKHYPEIKFSLLSTTADDLLIERAPVRDETAE